MSQGDDAERNGVDRNRPLPLDPVQRDAVQDEALRWFLELQGAEGNPAVRRMFDAWLAQDRRHAATYAKVSALWKSAELGRALTSPEPVPMRNDRRVDFALLTAKRPPVPTSRSWGRPIAAIAAVLILAVAAGYFSGLFLYLGADYVTATGQQQRVSLPDGSTVVLNSGSAIALDFSDTHRIVRLIEGEVFFDVARNPDRPFHVTGRFADVEVTGTAFSVRATIDTDNVTLQHGSVSVRPRSGHASAVKLLPRHAVAVSATETGAVDAVDPDDAFAWLNGRMRFRDRRLSDVLDELRRYHRGVIIVANGRIGEIRVSGNYRIDDPALVVASLAEAVGATLTRLSDRVLILY